MAISEISEAIILPRKPSALLRIAVADCKKVARMKSRKLDMSAWHCRSMGKCLRCMAGAIMDRTLRTPAASVVSPASFPGNYDQLHAVNSLRDGLLLSACADLGIPNPDIAVREEFTRLIGFRYISKLGRAPWSAYLRAADFLEEHGL